MTFLVMAAFQLAGRYTVLIKSNENEIHNDFRPLFSASEISTDRAEAQAEISRQECGVRFTKFTTAKSISRLGQAIYMKQNTSHAFPDLS